MTRSFAPEHWKWLPVVEGAVGVVVIVQDPRREVTRGLVFEIPHVFEAAYPNCRPAHCLQCSACGCLRESDPELDRDLDLDLFAVRIRCHWLQPGVHAHVRTGLEIEVYERTALSVLEWSEESRDLQVGGAKSLSPNTAVLSVFECRKSS